MPKVAYKDLNLKPATLKRIERANQIIAEYSRQGFQLTLRQLYYQHVARGFIPNNDREYKNLGELINDGRLAGHIDWNAIVDRTRNLRSVSHWTSPSSIINSAAYSFRLDKWDTQEWRPEVWIEKDALVGVIEGVCNRLDVPYFSCRGYVSQSEMWAAAQRLIGHENDDKRTVIFHLGDHDPSGKDMSRDIEERLGLFGVEEVKVERLALNMDQIQRYNPPPNPAKLTDSRANDYIARYGDDSWELDALEPQVISDLIEDAVLAVRDQDAWDEIVDREKEHRAGLTEAARRWGEVASYLSAPES